MYMVYIHIEEYIALAKYPLNYQFCCTNLKKC